jgi:hypothetical protein
MVVAGSCLSPVFPPRLPCCLRWWDFFPLRQAMVLQSSARARSKVASTLEDMADRQALPQ